MPTASRRPSWAISRVGPEAVGRRAAGHGPAFAIEVILLYGRVRWLLLRRGLLGAVERLREGRSEPEPERSPTGEGEVDDVAVGAGRIVDRAPGDPRGFVRSLILIALLVRRDRDGQLVIGVSRGPSLASRAWVETGGRALLAPEASQVHQLVKL